MLKAPLTVEVQNASSYADKINLFVSAIDIFCKSNNTILFNYSALRKIYNEIKSSNLSNQEKLKHLEAIKSIYRELRLINPQNNAAIKEINVYQRFLLGYVNQNQPKSVVKSLFNDMEMSNPEDEFFVHKTHSA